PGPADRRVARRVGVGMILLPRRAALLALGQVRPLALVVVLRLVVRTARVHADAPQHHVEVGCRLRRDRDPERAREGPGGLRKAQLRVLRRQLPARRVAQRARGLVDRLVRALLPGAWLRGNWYE